MVYPALLPLMRTPRLPVVDWTDAPADLSGIVRFVERRNLFLVRVPSHFNWPLQAAYPSYDGLRVPRLEPPPSLPCQETAVFNPSALALLAMHLSTVVTSSNFTSIRVFLTLSITSDIWEIRLKVSRCVEPLSYAARQLPKLTERCWPGTPTAGRSGSTPCRGYPQETFMSAHWIVPTWHFSTTPFEDFSVLFLQL